MQTLVNPNLSHYTCKNCGAIMSLEDYKKQSGYCIDCIQALLRIQQIVKGMREQIINDEEDSK